MAPTDFLTLKEKRDSLVVSALDYVVLLHDWEEGCPYIPEHLTDANGVLQELPAGWFTSGEIQKQAGVNLTPDVQISNVEGYGSSQPRRSILTSEGFTIDYFAQEWRKKNLELFYNVDMTTVAATPGRGFRARKSSLLTMRYYSVLVIAYDGIPGGEIYPWWVYSKVGITKRNSKEGQQGKELGMPMTMQVFEDTVWGGPFDFGVAGKGFDAIAETAGFLAPATSLNVQPPAAEITDGAMLQLTVLDNHGVNRTSECTFASSAPADATVSTTGLVTAVDPGTATITATLGGLTDTCAVTVV